MTDEVAVSKGAELSRPQSCPRDGVDGGVHAGELSSWGPTNPTTLPFPTCSVDSSVFPFPWPVVWIWGLWLEERRISCSYPTVDRGGYSAHSQAAPKPEAGFFRRS